MLSCLVLASFTSCANWLRVDMEDQIMEDKLFENNAGYTTVLNGIYTKMNEMYSSNLTMGQLDALAHLYNLSDNHYLAYMVTHVYDDVQFEGWSGDVWSSLYSLIANINVLLARIDEPQASIKDQYLPYVKGEALALRAFLHFDLLRLYGPIYSADTENNPAIPYQATESKEIQAILTAKQVIDKVIEDLNAASRLLEKDRIITEGVLDSDSEDLNEDNDFRYRQYRMNWFAVQSLLARAYLWKGDKTNALQCAQAVIAANTANAELTIFPWTSRAQTEGLSADRIFSSEVIFGLYNSSRSRLYDSYFNPTASFDNILTFDGKSLAAGDETSRLTYVYDDFQDVRRGMWTVENSSAINENGQQQDFTVLAFSKYKDVNTTKTFRYMIPLIRLSEVYLIAAECADDPAKKLEYINTIRAARNCVEIVAADAGTEELLQSYVNAEFYREFIGEGQIFFNYKRQGMTKILSGTINQVAEYDYDIWDYVYKYNDDMNFDPGNYVLPLPKVETDKRGK